MEKKRENFERLAERRVTEVIKKMRLIGNLSNPNNYTYTEEHVKQIFEALEKELKNLKSRFNDNRSEVEETFKFKF